MEEVRKEAGSVNVVFMKLDLASFKSIRSFVEKFNESMYMFVYVCMC
jgi:hypothetical protein